MISRWLGYLSACLVEPKWEESLAMNRYRVSRKFLICSDDVTEGSPFLYLVMSKQHHLSELNPKYRLHIPIHIN